MDGLRQPVGDDPPQVYWVRRGIVAAVLIGLAIAAWVFINSLASGEPGTGASNSPTSTPSLSPTVSENPARACGPDDITVETTTPASFSGSEPARFTVTVTLVGDTPCAVDPAAEGAAVVVTSGNEVWYDSAECVGLPPYGDSAKTFILDDGGSQELTAAWNLGRDEASCAVDAVNSVPGFYWVTASLPGVEAERVQFEVK